MPNKVSTFGFQLHLADRITPGHMAAALIEKTGRDFNHFGSRGVLYVDIVDNYLVGLILANKGNRQFLNSMQDGKGKYHVRKFKLADGEHGAEVGFFCMNPLSGKGLVTSYWSGVGPSKLKQIFKTAHQEMKDELQERYVAVGATREEPRSELWKQARKIWGRKFDMTVILNSDTFDEVLTKFSRISGLRVSVNPQLLDSRWFRAILGESQGATVSVALKKEVSIRGAVQAVRSLYKPHRDKITALRLVGLGLEGEDLAKSVGADRTAFDFCMYDEFLDKLPTSTFDQFQECKAVAELVALIKAEHLVFGRKPVGRNWLPRGPVEDISLAYE